MTLSGRKTFVEYLSLYKGRLSAEGRFARNALRDPAFPVLRSWPQLLNYLVMRRPPAEQAEQDAAERVWNAYEQTCK
jgi:hypothetical protein